MMEPLQQLTFWNLEDAIDLGLLRIPSNDLSSLQSELDDCWRHPAGNGDDKSAYMQAAGCLNNYIRHMSWVEYRPGDEIQIYRCATLSYLRHVLKELSEPNASDSDIERLRHEFDSLLREAQKTPNNIDEAKVRRVVYELMAKLHPSGNPSYSPVELAIRSLHHPDSVTWVVPEAGADGLKSLSSQEMRDALGLIHLPGSSQPVTILQSLILIQFKVSLSPAPLPNLYDEKFIENSKEGAWLIRTTICHDPNERFVQKHSGDKSKRSKWGYTIDISTDEYREGFPELILQHGPEAVLECQGFRWLETPPQRNPRDDDHAGFIEALGARR